jgi:hypothetical protein
VFRALLRFAYTDALPEVGKRGEQGAHLVGDFGPTRPTGCSTPRLVACSNPRAWLPRCIPPAAAYILRDARIRRFSRAWLARCKRGRWRPKMLARCVQAGEEEARGES